MSKQTAEFELTPPAETAIVRSVPTPAELLQMAVSQNVDVAQLRELMELQERWQKNEARKSYNEAMEQFKKTAPVILKNKRVSYESRGSTTEYGYASLDNVCDVLIPALNKHGITHRWRVLQENGVITVACVLTHTLGHSEETSLSGPADNSGGKNSIQAVGSTLSYLERYTLLAACGLAVQNGDDDGRTAGGMAADRIEELCEWIVNSKDADELKKFFKMGWNEAEDAHDKKAQAHFVQAKDARKKELGLK